MKNERTSKRVAKIAAKYLPMTMDQFIELLNTPVGNSPDGYALILREIKAMAGSVQTQRPDKETKKK